MLNKWLNMDCQLFKKPEIRWQHYSRLGDTGRVSHMDLYFLFNWRPPRGDTAASHTWPGLQARLSIGWIRRRKCLDTCSVQNFGCFRYPNRSEEMYRWFLQSKIRTLSVPNRRPQKQSDRRQATRSKIFQKWGVGPPKIEPRGLQNRPRRPPRDTFLRPLS